VKALTHYIDHINLRRAMLGRAPLDAYADYAELRAEIEALGSPEILAGDGEYTRKETEDRTNDWIDAIQELNRIEAEVTA